MRGCPPRWLDRTPGRKQNPPPSGTESLMDRQEHRIERRLAAIFAADVAAYSRLMGQDEVGTLRTHLILSHEAQIGRAHV